jgi:hypothetical protein
MRFETRRHRGHRVDIKAIARFAALPDSAEIAGFPSFFAATDSCKIPSVNVRVGEGFTIAIGNPS